MLVRQIDHQPQWLALPSPTGQPIDAECVEAAVAAEHHQPVGRLGRDSEARGVAFLVFLLGGRAIVPFDRADPALGRAQHGHRLALDQRLGGNFDGLRSRRKLGAAPAERRVAPELGGGPFDLLRDRSPLPLVARQQSAELRLLGRKPVELLADLDLLEPPQGAQPHVEDRVSLDFGQIPARDHLGLRVVALADNADHLVEIDIDDDLAVEDLHAPGDRRKTMAARPLQHVAAMIEKSLQCLLQIHHPRHALRVEDIEIERHPHFELGQAEELLHQHLRIDIAGFRLQHEADILGRLVADVGEERQLFLVEQSRDLLDQPPFLHLKRHLGDDDLVEPVAQRFRRPARPQPEPAATGRISLVNVFRRLDQHPACREVGTGNKSGKLADGAGRMVDQMQQRRTELTDIVRGDAGRHADGDTGGAVREQVRKAGGQDDRLAVLAVISLAEVDCIVADTVEHRLRHRRKAAFGVAHRRGVIAVDVAEIPLAVDERVALREILGEPHKGVIDRELAMRVELADDVADDAGAFLVARGGIKAQLLHRMQDSAMHRLEPVAHIGERARHDCRQRIGQVTLAERVGKIDVADLAGKRRHGHASITSTRITVCGPHPSPTRPTRLGRSSPAAQSAREPSAARRVRVFNPGVAVQFGRRARRPAACARLAVVAPPARCGLAAQIRGAPESGR